MTVMSSCAQRGDDSSGRRVRSVGVTRRGEQPAVDRVIPDERGVDSGCGRVDGHPTFPPVKVELPWGK
ncbi:hypothetical protein AB0D78_29300 [Streptomyces avermitilis]|uniref:hypothetical protein n=1 Tax=Streptomyces avermitilis TaxID=33903 RepID=UPI0033D638BA